MRCRYWSRETPAVLTRRASSCPHSLGRYAPALVLALFGVAPGKAHAPEGSPSSALLSTDVTADSLKLGTITSGNAFTCGLTADGTDDPLFEVTYRRCGVASTQHHARS